MAEVIIRQAVPGDAGSIYEIENLCFPDPWSMDALTYELDGEVVGYAGLWIIGDEGHITNVAVKPGFRNRKIGEGIIGVMIDFTSGEGIAHYTLEVRKSNVPAINLYEKFGFRTEGVRKKYYQNNGEDALIMWRHEE